MRLKAAFPPLSTFNVTFLPFINKKSTSGSHKLRTQDYKKEHPLSPRDFRTPRYLLHSIVQPREPTHEPITNHIMGSVVLPHLESGWHVDQAILSEEERLVVIRFGRDHDPDCMRQDEVLYKIAERVKNFAVIYVCDIDRVPDFNTMYELYDPCTVMFFFVSDAVCSPPPMEESPLVLTGWSYVHSATNTSCAISAPVITTSSRSS